MWSCKGALIDPKLWYVTLTHYNLFSWKTFWNNLELSSWHGLNCLIECIFKLQFYINNFPTRCNTKQSIYYSASSLYMFRVPTTPIIISTQNCNYSPRYCAATSPQRGQDSLATLREVAAQKIWPVPKAVVTVLCAPDDGCGWHPKNVEWTCRIVNRLLCVGSRWTIIDI